VADTDNPPSSTGDRSPAAPDASGTPGGWPTAPPEAPPAPDLGAPSAAHPYPPSASPLLDATPSSRGWATPESYSAVLEPGGDTRGLDGLGGLGGPEHPGDGLGRVDQPPPRADAAPPMLPVPLKPLTLSDLLDGSWAIIKARPKTVFLITAAIVIPVQVVVALLQRGLAKSVDFTTLFTNSSFSSSGRGMTLGNTSLA
jgi:hypothetical protein